MTALMAQRTRRLPTEQEIPGSNPGKGYLFAFARERCVRERREKESAQAVRGAPDTECTRRICLRTKVSTLVLQGALDLSGGDWSSGMIRA